MRQNARKKPPKQGRESNLRDRGLFFRHHIKRALRVEKLSPLKRESSRSSIEIPVKGRA